MRTTLKLLIVTLASGAASSASGASPAPAPYRVVHIDTPATVALFTQFESARRDWLKELERAHATDGRGVFLQIGDHQFYTVRSFDKFGSFDTRNEAIAKTQGAISPGASERYDDQSDSALAYPHTSEVWRLEEDYCYRPADRALTERTANTGRLIIEDRRADSASEKRYDAAVIEINRALSDAHYPLTRLGFGTSFGAGHTYTLWLASSKQELDTAPTIEAAVATVRGKARARELMAACAGAVERSETKPVIVRHDLTQDPPAVQ